MLTANQLCVLFPQVADEFNNNSKKRSPRRCLFGSPDPLDTKKLLEEQFLADREMMIRKYNFDILTSRPATSVHNLETLTNQRDSVDDVKRNVTVPACIPIATEIEDNVSESEVRHRTGRFSPYNRQTRITDFWRRRKSTIQSSINKRTTKSSIQNLVSPQNKL